MSTYNSLEAMSAKILPLTPWREDSRERLGD